jgi:hypothetical protein
MDQIFMDVILAIDAKRDALLGSTADVFKALDDMEDAIRAIAERRGVKIPPL